MIDRFPAGSPVARWRRKACASGFSYASRTPSRRARSHLSAISASSVRAASASSRAIRVRYGAHRGETLGLLAQLPPRSLRVSSVAPGFEGEGQLGLVAEARARPSAERGERIDAALPIARLIDERIEIDSRFRLTRPRRRAGLRAPPRSMPRPGRNRPRLKLACLPPMNSTTPSRPRLRRAKGMSARGAPLVFARHDDERRGAARGADGLKPSVGECEGLIGRGAGDRFELVPVAPRFGK